MSTHFTTHTIPGSALAPVDLRRSIAAGRQVQVIEQTPGWFIVQTWGDALRSQPLEAWRVAHFTLEVRDATEIRAMDLDAIYSALETLEETHAWNVGMAGYASDLRVELVRREDLRLV